MRILLVGEAWGEREAMFQHALVGSSGRELARMIEAAGLAPAPSQKWPSELNMIAYWRRCAEEHDLHIANVFNARPPGNQIFEFFDREGSREFPSYRNASRVGYVREEYAHHVRDLHALIAERKPNIVVAMGNTACWATVGQTKISALRGTVIKSQWDIKVLPTYHPAAVLRQWNLRTITIADLRKAAAEASFADVRRKERWITIPAPNESGLQEIRGWLNRHALAYANDIETGMGQISMVGFARSDSSSLVIPFIDADISWTSQKIENIGRIAQSIGYEGGIHFWPTVDLEVEAWKLMIRGLKRPIPKIYQNGLYDMGHFLRAGIMPAMPREDTMLKEHAKYLEAPKSLGHLASKYCNEISWKLMAKRDTLKRDE